VSAAKSRARDIRRVRCQSRHSCWDHIIVAPLWVGYQANLGTLLRTCDAAGACIALPDTNHYHQALSIGDSRRLRDRACVHWLDTGKDRWVRRQELPLVVFGTLVAAGALKGGVEAIAAVVDGADCEAVGTRPTRAERWSGFLTRT
jgi:hypothetical protein